ncbi:MAG: aldehyde dehydrogenase family protein, partial [Flavobacteriaceae bacterium]
MNSSIIKELKDKHHRFFKTLKNQSIKVRIQHLKRLKYILDDKEEDIYDALYKDLKKPVFESFSSEFLMVQKEINSFIKNIKDWSEPEKISGNLMSFPSQDYILHEPYGTVLMISPWNYPFQLAMLPLIGAVGTGNTV